MIRNTRVVILCASIAGVLSLSLSPSGAFASAAMRSGTHEPSATAATSATTSAHRAAAAQARLAQAARQPSVLALEDLRPVSAEADGARLGFSRGERVSASRERGDEGEASSPVGRNAVLIVGLGIALISVARRMGRY